MHRDKKCETTIELSTSRPQSGFNDNVSRYASVLAYRTRNIVSCYSLLLYKNQKCNCVVRLCSSMILDGRSGNVCHCVIGMQARYWNGGGGPTSIRGGDDAPPPAVESGKWKRAMRYSIYPYIAA